MPTSTYAHIPTLVGFLNSLRPGSILDIGVGSGKMGFIARDLLDVMLGQRCRRRDWQVVIDGIEVFGDYIQDHQRAIYDRIHIGDAFAVIDTLGLYDLVILGDVLEHFPRERAWQFLDKCFEHTRGNLILNLPLGRKWTQGAEYGNEHERHLSFWSPEEIVPFALDHRLHAFPGLGDYGCFLLDKTRYEAGRIRRRADALFSQGRQLEAVQGLAGHLDLSPPDKDSEYLLVDLLLRMRRIGEARARLHGMQQLFPDDPAPAEYLARLEGVPEPAAA